MACYAASMIPFFKYEGLGNDFVLLDLLDGGDLPGADVARRVCDRHFGVGADGLLSLIPPRDPAAHVRMHLWNSDGSEAEMCGNGIRCLAVHAVSRHGLPAAGLRVETASGLRTCDVQVDATGAAGSASVDMGLAAFASPDLPPADPALGVEIEVAGRPVRVHPVSMGNPHAVVFVSDPAASMADLGRALEPHPAFPRGTNAEFVQVDAARRRLRVSVWERGCGPTLACGTGACACAAAAVRTGRLPPGGPIEVALPGGSLWIEVPSDGSGVRMTGPATLVFEGRLP
jgi:diaminopimelate epimerase